MGFFLKEPTPPAATAAKGVELQKTKTPALVFSFCYSVQTSPAEGRMC
jgi:hypothetical protein